MTRPGGLEDYVIIDKKTGLITKKSCNYLRDYRKIEMLWHKFSNGLKLTDEEWYSYYRAKCKINEEKSDYYLQMENTKKWKKYSRKNVEAGQMHMRILLNQI